MLPDILCAETISAHRGLSMKAAKALLYLTSSSMVPFNNVIGLNKFTYLQTRCLCLLPEFTKRYLAIKERLILGLRLSVPIFFSI